MKSWFGFTLRLAVDAQDELPVAYWLSPAATSEVAQGHRLLQGLQEDHPVLLEGCQ